MAVEPCTGDRVSRGVLKLQIGQCHENDMEGVLLTVAQKPGAGPFGALETVAMVRHRDIIKYDTEEFVLDSTTGRLLVFSEPLGHALSIPNQMPDSFTEGIVYYPDGVEVGLIPADQIEYHLVEIDELWESRFDRTIFDSETGNFLGNDGKCNAAKPPWRWDNDGDGQFGVMFDQPGSEWIRRSFEDGTYTPPEEDPRTIAMGAVEVAQLTGSCDIDNWHFKLDTGLFNSEEVTIQVKSISGRVAPSIVISGPAAFIKKSSATDKEDKFTLDLSRGDYVIEVKPQVDKNNNYSLGPYEISVSSQAPIQDPSKPIFGPVSSRITHRPDNNLREIFEGPIINSADVMVDATFINPDRITWSYGLVFRGRSDDNKYEINFHSHGSWDHRLILGGDTKTLVKGQSPHIDRAEGGKNRIRLILVGDTGWLFINGEVERKLDLSVIQSGGSIDAYITDEKDGEVTDLLDFTVWKWHPQLAGIPTSTYRLSVNGTPVVPGSSQFRILDATISISEPPEASGGYVASTSVKLTVVMDTNKNVVVTIVRPPNPSPVLMPYVAIVTAYIDGAAAADGTEVVALMEGRQVASGKIVNGVATIFIPGPLKPDENSMVFKTIYFRIGDLRALETDLWEPGKVGELKIPAAAESSFKNDADSRFNLTINGITVGGEETVILATFGQIKLSVPPDADGTYPGATVVTISVYSNSTNLFTWSGVAQSQEKSATVLMSEDKIIDIRVAP